MYSAAVPIGCAVRHGTVSCQAFRFRPALNPPPGPRPSVQHDLGTRTFPVARSSSSGCADTRALRRICLNRDVMLSPRTLAFPRALKKAPRRARHTPCRTAAHRRHRKRRAAQSDRGAWRRRGMGTLRQRGDNALRRTEGIPRRPGRQCAAAVCAGAVARARGAGRRRLSCAVLCDAYTRARGR